ncbi:hypothetical protein XFLM_02615 [Xylella fastidiosa subsp. fastidiosa GB514]|nr:hypothetical protein XFLM_02615 [Xylella fastidiosa subsp. fastidiosa GB514]AIC13939.1 hypothetical protein P303_08415 [Xylella fastidiosa MUL0034]
MQNLLISMDGKNSTQTDSNQSAAADIKPQRKGNSI